MAAATIAPRNWRNGLMASRGFVSSMVSGSFLQRVMGLARDFFWPVIAGIALAMLYLQQVAQNNSGTSVAPLSVEQRPAAPQPIDEPSSALAPHSYADAVERAMPAVVNIYTGKIVRRVPLVSDPFLQRFLERNAPAERIDGALGSGVVASADGYVLTNLHVIAEANDILVSLHDGRDVPARVVGVDSETDLAVLKIELPELSPIVFGDPQRARIGDVVLAIGNPFGVGQTVTQGIISAAARYGMELSIQENYLQTDAAINQGNSGGALIDTQGRLLGINTAIQSPTGGSVGIGYALPADTARKVLTDIITHGSVVRGWLGIETQAVPEYTARSLGLSKGQGIVIRAVYRGGPADVAGLRAGDIITHFDNAPAMSSRAGMKRITHAKPGDTLSVRYISSKRISNTQVTIGVKPARQ